MIACSTRVWQLVSAGGKGPCLLQCSALYCTLLFAVSAVASNWPRMALNTLTSVRVQMHFEDNSLVELVIL